MEWSRKRPIIHGTHAQNKKVVSGPGHGIAHQCFGTLSVLVRVVSVASAGRCGDSGFVLIVTLSAPSLSWQWDDAHERVVGAGTREWRGFTWR